MLTFNSWGNGRVRFCLIVLKFIIDSLLAKKKEIFSLIESKPEHVWHHIRLNSYQGLGQGNRQQTLSEMTEVILKIIAVPTPLAPTKKKSNLFVSKYVSPKVTFTKYPFGVKTSIPYKNLLRKFSNQKVLPQHLFNLWELHNSKIIRGIHPVLFDFKKPSNINLECLNCVHVISQAWKECKNDGQ